MDTSRPEKILLAMCDLSKGTTSPCLYEDIVVRAFEMFPKDFQLRGHPQYPDSSDIHKPLYGPLKRQGYVRAANKRFALTDFGLEKAKSLQSGSSTSKKTTGSRLDRSALSEIEKLSRTATFQLYMEGKHEDILDTDFYSYLGVNVRTNKNDFLGRLNSLSEIIASACKQDPSPLHSKLYEMHMFLIKKYDGLIKKKTGA
jgi:hypothetical protein